MKDKDLSARYPFMRLPETIAGDRVALHALRPRLWDFVSALLPEDHREMRSQLTLWRKPENIFSDRGKFFALCDELMNRETASPSQWRAAPQRSYIVIDQAAGRFVGTVETYLPCQGKDVLAVGYSTTFEHRNRGYASEAVKLLSDKVVAGNLFPCICAETDLGNGGSARVLRNAGFAECAFGLCSTVDYPGKTVRRFIRARIPPDCWPLPAK